MASYSASTRPSNWCQRERRTGTDYYHTYAPLVHILWCSTGINRFCHIWTCLSVASQCMACWTQGGVGDWGEEQRVSGLITVVLKRAARENGRTCTGESVQRSEASEPWYDRNAQKRSFQPGDQVLILLAVPPTSTGKVSVSHVCKSITHTYLPTYTHTYVMRDVCTYIHTKFMQSVWLLIHPSRIRTFY